MLNLFALAGGQNRAVGAEQLHAVPRRRVVARGDLDAAGRVELANRESHGRCRRDAKIVDLAAARFQPRDDGVTQHLPAGSRIARQHDAATLEIAAKRLRKRDRRHRGKPRADDAANARDADNQFAADVGHDDSVW